MFGRRRIHRLSLFRPTEAFPKAETYGLTIRIRRIAASIAANIAEGCGKPGNGEFQRFSNIAGGSASELEYHFLLARDLAFLRDQPHRGRSEANADGTGWQGGSRTSGGLGAAVQNFVTSVKLKSRTFIGGTTMSNDSSPLARTGVPMASTFESI